MVFAFSLSLSIYLFIYSFVKNGICVLAHMNWRFVYIIFVLSSLMIDAQDVTSFRKFLNIFENLEMGFLQLYIFFLFTFGVLMIHMFLISF